MLSYIKKLLFILVFLSLLFSYGCKQNSNWKHSAAVIVKGREVKMTMYGSYFDAITQWSELTEVLNKIVETHSTKKVLIRIAPYDDEKEDALITDFVVRKIENYFESKGVAYDVKDERKK